MLKRILAGFGLALVSQACMTMGMYRTAHILPKHEGDISLGLSAVRVSTDDMKLDDGMGGTQTEKGMTTTYPNVIPEVSYHYGVADDVEVGGRVALGAGMIELDTKLRFVGNANGPLHLAIQPALGYRTLGIVEGFHVGLPLILTYDVDEHVSLSFSAFGMYEHFRTSSDLSSSDINFAGDNITVGGAAGVQLETKGGFHFMPAIEVQRSVYRGGDALKDAPGFTYVVFGIVFGWGPDKTYAKLEKMDEKLDRIDDKLDRLNDKQPEPTPVAPPAATEP